MDRLIRVFVLLLLGLSFCRYGGISGSFSGLYVDNGVDQTIMHEPITMDEAQEVEHEILELLGLPDRPRRKRGHPSLR